MRMQAASYLCERVLDKGYQRDFDKTYNARSVERSSDKADQDGEERMSNNQYAEDNKPKKKPSILRRLFLGGGKKTSEEKRVSA